MPNENWDIVTLYTCVTLQNLNYRSFPIEGETGGKIFILYKFAALFFLCSLCIFREYRWSLLPWLLQRSFLPYNSRGPSASQQIKNTFLGLCILKLLSFLSQFFPVPFSLLPYKTHLLYIMLHFPPFLLLSCLPLQMAKILESVVKKCVCNCNVGQWPSLNPCHCAFELS